MSKLSNNIQWYNSINPETSSLNNKQKDQLNLFLTDPKHSLFQSMVQYNTLLVGNSEELPIYWVFAIIDKVSPNQYLVSFCNIHPARDTPQLTYTIEYTNKSFINVCDEVRERMTEGYNSLKKLKTI